MIGIVKAHRGSLWSADGSTDLQDDIMRLSMTAGTCKVLLMMMMKINNKRYLFHIWLFGLKIILQCAVSQYTSYGYGSHGRAKIIREKDRKSLSI